LLQAGGKAASKIAEEADPHLLALQPLSSGARTAQNGVIRKTHLLAGRFQFSVEKGIGGSGR